MKKYYFIFFLLFNTGVNAQWVSIPDTNFGTWLNTNGYSACMQGNNSVGWQMDTTCATVVNAIKLNCNYANIADLTGVQYFDNLDTLECLFNSLHALPALPGSLRCLMCDENQLSSLPALPQSLTLLWCGVNQLSSLPALPASMLVLQCAYNQLSSLPDLPDSLTYFDCSDNPNLYCLPELKKVRDFRFYNTGITCLPNYPLSNSYSLPLLSSIPLCDSLQPNPCAVISDISLAPNLQFTIYPNPATNYLYFETIDMIVDEVNIYNATGSLVNQIKQPLNNFINISQLAGGVYIVEVKTYERSVRRRWVKVE